LIREYGRVVAKIPEIIEQNEPQSQCADNAMILRARMLDATARNSAPSVV
jgi:hypothetical protein